MALSLFVVVSVAGLVLVQRLVPTQTRQEHNDVAGFIYAVLGVAYALLLGLTLIAVWEELEVAENTVRDEANELAENFAIAQGLPPREGERIQELTRSYAQVVVEDEWALMAQGEASPRAWELLDEIRDSIGEVNPATSAQQALYEQALERVHALTDARSDRLLEAEEGIPAILWAVLLVGGESWWASPTSSVWRTLWCIR